MACISVLWLLQKISGLSSWMLGLGFVLKFMSSHNCFWTRCTMISFFHSVPPSLYLLIPACVCLQEWITEQWEKNYHITAVAGATNGSSLVVMSKGLLIIFSLLNATLIMSTFFCGKWAVTVKQEWGITYCAPKLCALHTWLSDTTMRHQLQSFRGCFDEGWCCEIFRMWLKLGLHPKDL